MIIKQLPDFQECEYLVNHTEEYTPLHSFIYENEPEEAGKAKKFREDLLELLNHYLA